MYIKGRGVLIRVGMLGEKMVGKNGRGTIEGGDKRGQEEKINVVFNFLQCIISLQTRGYFDLTELFTNSIKKKQ